MKNLVSLDLQKPQYCENCIHFRPSLKLTKIFTGNCVKFHKMKIEKSYHDGKNCIHFKLKVASK